MSIKLAVHGGSLKFLGTGYLPPVDFELSSQLSNLTDGIQNNARETLRAEIDRMREELELKYEKFELQRQSQIQDALDRIEQDHQTASAALLDTFKFQISASLTRFWNPAEKTALTARVLSHLVHEGLIADGDKIVVPKLNHAALLDALESINDLDINLVKGCIEGVDYLPNDMCVVDGKSLAVSLNLDDMTRELTSVLKA